MKHVLAILPLLAAVLALSPAAAAQQVLSLDPEFGSSNEAWPGPDPSRVPTGAPAQRADDFDFALSELCFPFVLSSEQPSMLFSRPGVSEWRRQDGESSYPPGAERVARIGESMDLTVTFVSMPDDPMGKGRTCSIYAKHNDPAALYASANARLKQWPTRMERRSASVKGSESFCGVRDDGSLDLIMGGGQLLDEHLDPAPGLALTIARIEPTPAMDCRSLAF